MIEEHFIYEIIISVGIIFSFFISLIINKKYNPKNYMSFKYGYFLSVFIIFLYIIFISLLIMDINEKSYRVYYYGSEIALDIFLIILLSLLFFSSSILNAKRYKIGAILISILTGNFIICIFYYKKRWHEFKNLSEFKKNLSIKKYSLINHHEEKIESFKNMNYKSILSENGLENYIQLFEQNKLNDMSIIIELNENDYEKLGVNLMGDRKRLLKVFSKNNINENIINENSDINENNNKVYEQKNIHNKLSINNGMTAIIINRNFATASDYIVDLYIDNVKKLSIKNNSSELILLERGRHVISAGIESFSISKEIYFIADGIDITFNIYPRSVNEIEMIYS